MLQQVLSTPDQRYTAGDPAPLPNFAHQAPEYLAPLPGFYCEATHSPPGLPYAGAPDDGWAPEAQHSHRSTGSLAGVGGTGVFVPTRQRRR